MLMMNSYPINKHKFNMIVKFSNFRTKSISLINSIVFQIQKKININKLMKV